MSERIIYLVNHHANRFIPELAKKGFVEEKGIFFNLGVSSVNYPFLWDKDKIGKFTARINEAIQADREGNIVVVSEREKRKDHICQVCDNLVRGKCKLEKMKLNCFFI